MPPTITRTVDVQYVDGGRRKPLPYPFDDDQAAAAIDTAAREALAAYAHEAWSGWMRYLFSKCDGDRDDGMRIPAWAVVRWTRQINTSYADLPELEKESDRAEADKILALLLGEPK